MPTRELLLSSVLAWGALNQSGAAEAGPEGPLVVSEPIEGLTTEAYAEQAAEEWDAITNKTDGKELDYFIHTYQESDEAVDAFTIRLEVVRGSGSIEQYNEFIQAHARRMAAQLAIGEVYQLYRDQDRLSGYTDFIQRYPNTPEAGVARLHAQQIGFEFATLLNKEKAMDEYMLAFPEAPQVFAASDLAGEMLLAQHQAEYAEVSKRMSEEDRDKWVNRRLRTMRFQYRDLWTAINEEEPSEQTLDFLERDVLGYRPEKMTPALRQNLADRMKRIYYVVRWFKPYQTAEASDEIVAEARHQELIAKLEEIRQTLEKNHQELIAEIKKEMEATRGVLKEGFDRLAKEHQLDRQLMEAGFTQMKSSMDQLHHDLGAIYGELRSMHGTMKNIDQRLAQTNQSLAKIDQSLAQVQSSIVNMHNDMNKGFTGVQNRLTQINSDLNQGFAKQHAIASAQLDVANQSLTVQKQSLQAQAATLSAINHGFDKLDNTMQTGFTQLEEATWQSATMVAESNREMVANLQPTQQEQESGGFFSKALGTVGDFVPVVGPLVGEVAGTVLDEVVVKGIKGEKIDPLNVGKQVLVGAVESKFGKRFPGAAGMAGNLFDQAVVDKRFSLEKTAYAMSDMGIRGPGGIDPRMFADAVSGGGGGGGMPGSVEEFAEEAWFQLKEKAVTEENFRKVSDELGKRYNIPPEAVDFAAERIF